MAGDRSVKVPPQNVEVERSVLGGILIDPDAINKVLEFLSSEDFYRTSHRVIFNAILSLYQKSEPADLVTVTNELRSNGDLDTAGGASYLSSLVDSIPTAANIVHYGKIIHEKAIVRKLIQGATEIAEMGYDNQGTGVDTFLDKAEQIIFEIAQKKFRPSFYAVKDLVKDSFKTIEDLYERKELVTGVPTGFHELDKITSGLQPSDLIIVAGRPSMGKTAFALNVIAHASKNAQVSSAIFSLEMSKEQLVQRLLCAEAQVNAQKLRGGFLAESDWPKLTRAAGALSESDVYIDDTPALNVIEMRAKARRLQREKGLGLVVVDYMQLMRGLGSSESREREISEISRSLKALAKELHIPVMALSQLNRAVENRTDKRPQLADLRESGCLTADTQIMRADTGRLTTIGELYLEREENVPVLSMDSNLKLKNSVMSHLFSTGVKEVYELKTASGRQIKATSNHPFYTVEGWKKLGGLSVGHHVAVPRTLEMLKVQNDMPEDRIILLAHLIGDGCYLKRQPLHYTNADLECLKVVADAAENEFDVTAKWVKQENWHHVYLSANQHLTHGKRNPIAKWLDELGIFGQRSGEKKLPLAVFEQSTSNIVLFLRHLWATDGCVHLPKNGGRKVAIFYASKSKELIQQLQMLLLRVGVQGRISLNRKKGYDPVYQLHISDKPNQWRFLDGVGVFGRKEKIVHEALRRIESVESNPNVDVIPKQIWSYIRDVKDERGLSWREFAKQLGMSFCGSSLFKSSVGRKRIGRIASILNDPHLYNLCESDLFWDEITSIKSLGKAEVFDATVPGEHNFIADNIIVHNSIEQDADVVMFVYRDEVYNKESSDQGTAEIIVGKQRNGPTGYAKLAFLKHYTRFENLARGLDDSVTAPPIDMGTDLQEETPF